MSYVNLLYTSRHPALAKRAKNTYSIHFKRVINYKTYYMFILKLTGRQLAEIVIRHYKYWQIYVNVFSENN